MSLDPGSLTIGVREAVVGLIVIVALYMLVVLLRMRSLRRKAAASRDVAEAKLEPVVLVPPPETPPVAEKEPEAEASWPETSEQLASETFMQGVEEELAQLREEVDALRGEVAALRNDLQLQVDHMRSAQTISPLYSDAMQMASAGRDAATIAERCGIARAEAELVVALVHSQAQLER